MKKLTMFLFAAFLIFLFPKEIEANNPVYMHGYFYSNLTTYGTWISLDYGVYAWRPTIITRTWAPYKIGRWIWSDYGWYWDSYEPFGYIVYHYGRWHYDDYYGWIWIPDYEWAPAWVEWRYNDYYIGWAPLPPYAVFRISVGIFYTHSYIIPVAHWHFVNFRYFGNPYVYNYYVPERTKYRIHSNTKFRNDYRYSGGRIRNEGVDFDFVRQKTGDTIRKRDLLITDDPRNIENSRNRDRDQITTFIADRDRIITDRESLRNVEVVKNERRSSLDLSRVELGETRNRNEQVRNNENENVTTRESNSQIRQERTDDRKNSERRNIEKWNTEQRNNNQVREEQRNIIIQEQRRSESRENEINRERESIQSNNRDNQKEQNRRNDSWMNSNNNQQRNLRNPEERRIEQNYNQKNDNREFRSQQRNENSRTERNREDVNQDRRHNTEQRQRTR